MTRRIIETVLSFALRVYFRRVEVAGLDHVPEATPVIFVLNHPNALVDPAFLLCLAPRRVSFLAKAPLFKIPILSFFVRALDSLPVYRRQDEGSDVSRNAETFVAARRLLASGGTIGICPEGVSHDRPGLQPIKTGAARIALAAVSTGAVADLKIVPAGLYYTSKTSFRSEALLYFGTPLPVEPVDLDELGNPKKSDVRELSRRIESSLREVMLDAEHEEALQTTARAERIFNGPDDDEESLTEELRLQQLFIKAYSLLQERAPDRLRRLETRMLRFEEELKLVGIDPEELAPPESTTAVFVHLVSRMVWFVILLPATIIGTVIHYPAYRLGGYLATRLSQNAEDVVSTVKIISALLLFPLTWLAGALTVYELVGWKLAVITLVLLPASGYIAIRFFESLDAFLGGMRALTFFLTRRKFFVRLLAERNAIRNEIVALGNEVAIATQ